MPKYQDITGYSKPYKKGDGTRLVGTDDDGRKFIRMTEEQIEARRLAVYMEMDHEELAKKHREDEKTHIELTKMRKEYYENEIARLKKQLLNKKTRTPEKTKI